VGGETLLRLRGIVKTFPGVLAGDHVDFDVRAGEVHGLLGENGSGKTTLMRIAYGMLEPDAGEIFVGEEKASFSSSRDAIEVGIGMVHQHFTLVPSLSVAENLVLGFEPSRMGLLDLREIDRRVEELREASGLPSLELGRRADELTVGEQQWVEITKALLQQSRVLILDEPTAVLTPQEVEVLASVIGQLRARGLGIVLITHKLREVEELCDRVTVLRHGKRVAERAAGSFTRAELTTLMVGREIPAAAEYVAGKRGGELLRLVDVVSDASGGDAPLAGVSLQIDGGEVLGIAGVDGNGQRTLADVVGGLVRLRSGEMSVHGKRAGAWDPKTVADSGVAYIPQDRETTGVVQDFTVGENLMLKGTADERFVRKGCLRSRQIRANALEMIERFDIRPPDPNARTGSLSGGNRQKVILARELSLGAKVVVAAEPTRGLDVGAISTIRKALAAVREEGGAVLLISTDLDEVLELSDRVAVLHEGKVMGLEAAGPFDRQQIGSWMAGVA
jgi:simple sugar transport system ATP-binding protein